ncbi:MAG: C10 family peptidase [Kiritimatiellae bacterium]|nr:C10 family peptidase [Kiritimatiellia bacterium]
MRIFNPVGAISKMVVFGLLCVTVGMRAFAVEVTPEMASRAVKNWRATRDAFGCKFGSQVAAARRCESGEAKFNVVKLEGGGFVVTSADTEVRPILFFCDGEDLDEDPRNPLFALLKQDMRRAAAANRKGRATLASVAPVGGGVDAEEGTSGRTNERQWAELLTEASAARLSAIRTPSDIRVDKLVQSKWSQSTVSGGGLFSSKKNVYNYYTPNNYVCGCVATAMAQIMRYHQFPTASMPQFSNPYCSVDKVDTELTSLGGTYDWANMPLSPGSSIKTDQQKAIGKLCYDAGVAVSMSYKSSGSGSNVFIVPHAFVNRFGYRGAMGSLWSDGNSSVSLERTRRAMITNFDAGLPIEIGITGDGGHAIVADGYGYSSGSFCCHLNFGWSGTDDGWYIPPDLGDYNLIDELAYNIFPTQDPTCAIVSGRVLSSSGSVASGVAVKAVKFGSTSATTTTNSKGIFALFVKPGTYSIKAESGLSVVTVTATPTALKSLSPVIQNGNPTGSYWTGNRDAEICNVHVGDIKLVNQTPIAKIGMTNYLSLQAACAAAAAGQTVTLLADTAETEVTATKGITVDFAGHTLTGTLYAQNNTSGQTLTLKNGTISGASDSFDGASGTTTTFPNGAVNFENMTMTGTVWSDEHPLTFVSGTYEGTISIGAASATILDGKYASLAHTGTGLFVVKGGAFAGSFSGLVSPPSGYALVRTGTDPVYPWTLGRVVARIGEDGYPTFAAACSAALAGQTVVLVDEADESEILLTRGCTIDLGGHTFAGHFICTNAISTTVAFTNGKVTGEISVVGRGAASVSNACTVATLHGESAGMLRVDGGTATSVVQDGTGKLILMSGTIGQATGASFTMAGGTAGTVLMTDASVVSGGTVTSLTSGGSVKLTGGTLGTLTVAGTALSTMTDTVVDCLVHTGTGRVTVNGGSYRSFTTTGTGAVVLRGGRYGAPVTGDNVTLTDGYRWVQDGQDAICPWILSNQIACIGDRFFGTLAEACAAAAVGEKVSLLADDDESEVLVKNKCVIDFCGNVFSGTLVCTNAISTTVVLVNGRLTGEVSVVGRGAVSVSNDCTVAMLRGKSAGMLRVDGGTVTSAVQESTGKVILMSGQIDQVTGESFTMNGGTAGTVSMTGASVVSGGTVTSLVSGGSVKLTGGTYGTVTAAGTALSTVTDVVVDAFVHTGTGRVTVNGGLFGSFTTAGNGAVVVRDGRFGERIEGENVSLAEGFYWYRDNKEESYPWRLTTIRPSERTATCILLR